MPLNGTYLIQLHSQKKQTIASGKFAGVAIEQGYYLYIGSALGPGGIKSRVGRHLKKDKPLKWHIDHLRQITRVSLICLTYQPQRLEDDWVGKLAENRNLSTPIKGFGATDTRHHSHLFYSAQRMTRDAITENLATRNLEFVEFN